MIPGTVRTATMTSVLLLVLAVAPATFGAPPQETQPPGERRTAEAAAAEAATRPPADLPQVPAPDLTPLEPAVAEQIAAVRATAEAAITDPESTPDRRAEVYGDLGRVYHAYGLLEPARVAYENAATLAPGNYRWPYLLGALHQAEGRFGPAAEAYDRVLEIAPRALPALIHRGEVALAADRPDEAEGYLLRALETDPKSAAARAVLGQVALSRREYARAATLLEGALEALPAADRLHYPLALAYRGLGDEAKAREHLALRGEVGARPPDPLLEELEELKQGERVHLLRGGTAFRAGRVHEAAEAFDAAVMANPESVPARINLAAALSALGRTEAAIRELRMAISLEPRNPTAHYNLGLLLGSAGDLTAAVRELAAAIESAPQDPGMRLAYARALAAADRHAEALAAFQVAVRLQPLSAPARLGEAQVLVQLGRYAEARARLEDAAENFPDDPSVALGLVRLLSAAPDSAARDGARALALARELHGARPTDQTAEALTLALAETGRCAEAADVQERLAEVVEAAGDSARGAELREAAELYRAGPPCRPPVAGPPPDDAAGEASADG